jgi:hypothetical protein
MPMKVSVKSGGEGVVVAKGRGPHEVGKNSSGWYMEDFKPYYGSVTLENEKYGS